MDNNLEGLIADSRLAFIQGRYEVSLKLAKQALDQDSKNSDAHQCAGNAYMSKADYESAIEHYKKSLENDADNGDRYFNLGYAYASDNQPVKALEMFAKADEVGCSPNVVGQLYKIMAMLCFDMHRFNDAILNFIKSEKIIGIDMEVLQRKALSYSMSGDTIAGIEVANQMKLLAPTDYLGYRIAFNILLPYSCVAL
jgi:tetratricopeptide (TPR) repeat protein